MSGGLAKKLLQQSCDWLVVQTNSKDLQSHFAAASHANSHCRVGWCYGDLSNSYVLFKAAHALQSKTLQDTALQIAIKCTSRDVASFMVEDASLCHGTAGVAHLFLKWYRQTHDQRFKQSADFWYEQTVQLYLKDPEGLTGFNDSQQRLNKYGLLEGMVGVGLFLCSWHSPELEKWDECLLLNM